MSLDTISERIGQSSLAEHVTSWGRAAQAPAAMHLKGLVGSLPAFLIEHLARRAGRPLLCIQPDAEAAAYLHSDLEQVSGENDKTLLFPPTGHTPYDEEQVDDPAPLVYRADVLQQLADASADLVVTSIEALSELVPPPEALQQETTAVALGDEVAPDALASQLVDQRFERVEFVEDPGEVALRGGILDVFPFAGDYPIRIEFWGEEVDSLREFDVRTQRSISRLTTARLVPDLERDPEADHTPFFDYLPDDALLVTFDEGHLTERAGVRYEEISAAYEALEAEDRQAHRTPETLYLSGERFGEALEARPRLLFGTFVGDRAEAVLSFESRPQTAFNSNIDLLRQKIGVNQAEGVETHILCDSKGQRGRLEDLLADQEEAGGLRLSVESLHEGFEVPSLNLAVYTDHQIFDRYHRPTARKRKHVHGGMSRRQIQNLSLGDYVVHVDYGVGTFGGMQEITVRGKQQEAVRLYFRDDDVLYVNVNALYKLHKYTGKEGHKPRLTKLNSGQWERKKAKTKARVKEMARDLIKLYAKRKASEGHAFSEDSVWQREMEAAFAFEDTPDQAATSEAVKDDMEEDVPMDRLVCGDVGFGKTEIAVRAAFKAVQDGKQVAVLVPTTILASQHLETFTRRLASYPVEVDMISRFRTRAEQKETLRRLKAGQLDIIIGTHRLASKDIKFKEMGLLIIDEEQRFGVRVKERLRKMRVNVDTLTLTATPIPRTLQFSLLGARDLSIIATPPPNRQPIETEIHTFDQDLVRDAILYETSRGGQVFFIHNRVRSIQEMAEMVRAMVPNVRVRIAHGQMKSSELEEVMMDFVEERFDVLLSTNIIENGLDISNANTIVINRADRFGLGELHQLRGRVGRSQRKAFCYLLVPSVHGLTREARQRLQAVEEYTELGSGFNIAMRDLDIRGAGNLLGGEQSGFIEEVGFETYQKILDDAVKELRHDEFSDVFDEEAVPPAQEAQVDVEEDAFIPDGYISNSVERLNMYRRISEAENEETLSGLREELEDRFGAIPPPVDHLLRAAELKHLAQQLRLAKVLFKNQRLFLYTPAEDEDPYFYEHVFHALLEKLNGLERRYALKDQEGKKIRAIVQEVPDLATAREIMERLVAEQEAPAAVS